jgi:D-alanyl-lipoteichoic acid acyltransferase DltB (MBOAT superfamily)
LYFKYLNFFVDNLNAATGMDLQVRKILLPLGISFFTFQQIGFMVDTYREDIHYDLVDYLFYVTFFPQLVAGPIVTHDEFIPQIQECKKPTADKMYDGIALFILGLSKKVLLADSLAVLVNAEYDNITWLDIPSAWITIIFYMWELYFDFSGYSDMSIGLGKMFGIDLPQNFNSPFKADSVKDFWRRWHITLGAWFKDYLYIPLGGNRRSKLRNYFNTMIVFLISGLWHGAAINFIIWGGLHGIYIVVGDILKPLKEKIISTFKIKPNSKGLKLIKIIITFILVDFAWIFFRAGSFTLSKTIIRNMLYFNPGIFASGRIYELGLDEKDFKIAILGILIVLIVDILQVNNNVRNTLANRNIVFRWSMYFIAIIAILIFGIYGPGYNAQQFIYFQF